MRRAFSLWIVWGGLLVLWAAVPGYAQTVEEILARHVEHRGGREALRAVTSVRLRGRMVVGGLESTFVMESKRPDKVRLEFEMRGSVDGGIRGVTAFDGETGWSLLPMAGHSAPEVLSGERLLWVREQADFDGPLVDAAVKGHRVALAGREKIDGHPVFRLRITRTNGEVVRSYLDAERYLELRRDRRIALGGLEVEIRTTYGEYREVGGILLAHRVEIALGDPPVTSAYEIEAVEWNADIADERFTIPKEIRRP